MTAPTALTRIDARPIPDRPDEIRCFLVVRNESLRLESTLRYHRELGVDRFFVIDNGSDDGTFEFLEAQPDVHLFSTLDSYASAHSGLHWQNTLLDAYGRDHWTLTIDADELFTYPHCEKVRLDDFCRFLDDIGAHAVFTVMLDMYSDQPLAQTVHSPGGSLIETCPFFDTRPFRVLQDNTFPHVVVFGGVRERLFQTALQGRFRPPVISKTPLVKWSEGVRFLASTHHLTPVPLAGITGALLHFKFLSDFSERAASEVLRGEHFRNAQEYRAYLELVRDTGLTHLTADVSAHYEDSAQLVRLSLMRSSDAYERFAADPSRLSG